MRSRDVFHVWHGLFTHFSACGCECECEYVGRVPLRVREHGGLCSRLSRSFFIWLLLFTGTFSLPLLLHVVNMFFIWLLLFTDSLFPPPSL